MKKYLLGIIAAVMAIGFSSFTGENSKATDTEYYFYVVDANGEIPAGSSVKFGSPVTLGFADANDGCAGTAKDCLRGFITPPTLPTNMSGDVQTRKN